MFKVSSIALATVLVGLSTNCNAFAPASFVNINNALTQSLSTSSTSATAASQLNMIADPAQLVTDATNLMSTMNMNMGMDIGTSNLLSFSDQGQNLAGIFFQASLLPYLTFLYFLSFRGNRTPQLGNFGFQFLLLFVFATIPSGIISKSVYAETLANVDWLHGGAEALLTVTNVLIVLGFRNAMTTKEEFQPPTLKPKLAAAGVAGLFAAACALGPGLGFEAHSEFLLGLGDLPDSVVESLPWVSDAVVTLAIVMSICIFICT